MIKLIHKLVNITQHLMAFVWVLAHDKIALSIRYILFAAMTFPF